MEEKIRFGANISALRRRKGMTQEQLAAALGVSAPAVSKWETDSSYPDITLLCPLARALGTDVDSLIGFEEAISEAEVVRRINGLMELAKDGRMQEAEEQLKELLKEYPSSMELKYYATLVYSTLEMQRLTEEQGELEKKGEQGEKGEKPEWKAKKRELLKAVCECKSASYRQNAICDLAILKVQDGETEQAEELLKLLPERQADSTLAWMQIYLARQEREKARSVMQNRLYVLITQIQHCLIALMGEKMEPDVEKALAIGEIYCQVEDLFGVGGGMGAVLLAEVFQRQGDKERELDAMMKTADRLNGAMMMPRQELFDTMKIKVEEARWSEMSRTMKSFLRAELKKEEYRQRFKDNDDFAELLKKLED